MVANNALGLPSTDWPSFPDPVLSVLAVLGFNVVTDFAADPSGVRNSDNAIRQAINAAETNSLMGASGVAEGSTVIYFPPGKYLITQTLRIRAHNIIVIGSGEGHNHSIINPRSPSMVSGLIWGGAVGVPMVQVMPDSGAARSLTGFIWHGVSLHGGDGNDLAATAVAGHGMHIRSVRHSKIRLYGEQLRGAVLYADCWPQVGSGHPGALGEFADTQDNELDIEGRQVLANCGPILEVHGDEAVSGASTADFSLNHRIWVRGSYGGGSAAHGVVIGNSDNNTFCSIDAFDQSAGASGAFGLLFPASVVAGAFARFNRVERAGVAQVKFEGTDVAVNVPSRNYVMWRDMQGVVTDAIYGPGAWDNTVLLGESFGDLTPFKRSFAVQLNEDVVTTSNTMVDIDGVNGSDLSFAVRPGFLYRFRFSGMYTVANVNTGLTISASFPTSGASEMRAMWSYASAGPSTVVDEFISTSDGGVGSTTTDSAGGQRYWAFEGQYLSNAQGTFQMRFKRNGTSSNVTIKKGAGGDVEVIRQYA